MCGRGGRLNWLRLVACCIMRRVARSKEGLLQLLLMRDALLNQPLHLLLIDKLLQCRLLKHALLQHRRKNRCATR